MVTTRVPQQDRSRATRQRLLEATIEVLAVDGWAACTVGVVAGRAGVSRGAAQHHFPTREDLITAALEHVFESLTMRATDAADRLPPGGERIEVAVATAVDFYTGPEFKAALQVWSAAASDDALKKLILPLEGRFGAAAHRRTVHMLGVDDSDPRVHRLVQATLDFARGLGLADTLSDDSARRKQVVAAWAEQLQSSLR
ncbi:TetR/AcrR family transcriptional regulator [Williamsia sp. 1135]|uniref:TetR/AcrR family transcriptional regulator n=1 Tax=Williamsia sp. 1135 TaxID=1889262 RepID=UPI000A1024F5|nr:TetR/AcrR family transcriptional regulator [Williamsia sp. 1135]ORM32261.1 TetR family transcriptional regulator [Williamsia sp. 1135]